MRNTLVACALGLAACASEGRPLVEVTKVTSTCEPRAAPEALCAVQAEIRTKFLADLLAVVALDDGRRELARAVIPLSYGRGVAQWGRVELRSSPPSPRVTVLGHVVEPTHAKLVVADAETTCAASGEGTELSCRTTGRVESPELEGWLVVVEAKSTIPDAPWWKSDEGRRAWAVVRVIDGKGAFSIEWRRPRAQAHSAKLDVRALGFVGNRAPRE